MLFLDNIFATPARCVAVVNARSASQIVSIPNINYLVLHDPPGDGSYSFIDDSLTVKGIVSNMQIRPRNTHSVRGLDQDIPVYPAPWSLERNIHGVAERGLDDLEDKGLLRQKNFDSGSLFLE